MKYSVWFLSLLLCLGHNGKLYGIKKLRSKKKSRTFVSLSSNVNYFNLGKDFARAITEIESLFHSRRVDLPLLSLSNSFSMKSDETIEREKTHFLPTANFGVGFIKSKHTFVRY